MAKINSVLQTLIYSDYFDFPLTFNELKTRLIQKKLSSLLLRQKLKTLLHQKIINYHKPYYFLQGRDSLIKNRKRNKKNSLPKLKLANSYAAKLSRVPGLCAIYLTGSLALQNAKLYDDIDFMIITETGKLWLTRLILTIYCELLGIRRRLNTEGNNKLCLNLYLSLDDLALPAIKRNLYTAYELIQAMPLYDPKDTRSQLLSSNSWLTHYLPNFTLPQPPPPLTLNPPNFFIFQRQGANHAPTN